jgi:hypothetical protein
MADIYALQGAGKRGKSETLKIVFFFLVVKYSVQSSQMQIFFHSKGEIIAILSNLKLANGKVKKVGIISLGDEAADLQNNITNFVNAGCDIIFCACRTSGNTLIFVNGFNPPHQVHITRQTVAATAQHVQSNITMAYTLIQQAGL